LGFALLNLLRHLAFIGTAYWRASMNERFDAVRFILDDVERPLFEPYGFCGAWVSYTVGQSAAFGLDLPAYIAATILHSAVNWEITCIDALTTPRGQILTALFVFPLWFQVGLSFQRFGQRRWRPKVEGGFRRGLAWLGLVPLPLGFLGVLFSILGAFSQESSGAARLAGIAFWAFYVAALAAERLWPFDHVDPSP
jgi:hypothetical protein